MTKEDLNKLEEYARLEGTEIGELCNLLIENGYTDKSNIIIEEQASDNPRLVLTPPHITDFFCDIAGVTKDDVSVNLLSTEEIGNE